MEVRSSERMRKEHITTFTQVFKDSHMEGKVITSLPVGGGALIEAIEVNRLLSVSQYSQMRDELFKSNMVCSFIMLLLLMAVQVLIPAPRYTCHLPVYLPVYLPVCLPGTIIYT